MLLVFSGRNGKKKKKGPRSQLEGLRCMQVRVLVQGPNTPSQRQSRGGEKTTKAAAPFPEVSPVVQREATRRTYKEHLYYEL